MYETTDKNLFEVFLRYLDEWKDFCADSQEMIPRHMLEVHGKYVVIKAYLDSNHAGNMENRRLHYGIIIHVNNSPMIWHIKHQNTVEASSFGSEFDSLRISIEMVEALRYKLRCFGLTVEVPAEVFCDNK